MSDLLARKNAHLSLCAEGDVEHRTGTLLDQVHLVHDALPELAFDEVDLSVTWWGRSLQLPILITGMTGGTPEAARVNRELAAAAQKHGLALGVGSQRAMLRDPATAWTYQLRDHAPDVPILANLGAVQARDAGDLEILELVRSIDADALCIHLNPAQELVQDDGDRDFRGCLARIGELVETCPFPIVVKETGCGLGPATLSRLCETGASWVDVSGRGGTSWTGVEALRGASSRQQWLGSVLREWGIPTAAAIGYGCDAGLRVLASGGIRDALDAARAFALGAEGVGMALPFLRALTGGGPAALSQEIDRLREGLRAVCVLTGTRHVQALREAPRVLGPELRMWGERR
ncbi:MAG: type 2 isopentenyl-diphosphate Delta-isomerase [Proteobacteria bacterium]|nr:type 2 isopentenyl-diphosphate Delta-isomerase [Pseudomonadota bacterium]